MSTAGAPPPPLDLSAVLALARLGWRVFPCQPRDKAPLVREWQHVATTDPQQIRAWYAEHPACNWGLACGAGSGAWVLDVDGPKGEAALKALVERYGSLPPRLTVRTGKGLHLYFAWPDAAELRNSAGKVGEGLDVRGNGGYVLAPGSKHPTGAIYAIAKDGPVSPAPAWLVQMATSPAPHTAAVMGGGINAGIVPGDRHKRLTHIIGRMLKDNMADSAILAAALAENATFNPPKSEAEVRELASDLVGRYRRGEAATEHAGFELMSLCSLLAKGDTPVEYIWEGRLIAGTVSGVVAKPKVGKSTFARNLCLAVARGEDFLSLSTRRGECIYLALEERESEVRADFAALGADGTEPILVHAAPTPAEGMVSLIELFAGANPVWSSSTPYSG